MSVGVGKALTSLTTKLMLLGCRVSDKEAAVELQEPGPEVIGVDRYENAPAIQVARRSYLIVILDGEELHIFLGKKSSDRNEYLY